VGQSSVANAARCRTLPVFGLRFAPSLVYEKVFQGFVREGKGVVLQPRQVLTERCKAGVATGLLHRSMLVADGAAEEEGRGLVSRELFQPVTTRLVVVGDEAQLPLGAEEGPPLVASEGRAHVDQEGVAGVVRRGRWRGDRIDPIEGRGC
jgi:hypothetical protein